jgi:anthranilate phosphoribosyltransferase
MQARLPSLRVNAGAAIYVAGRAASLMEGVTQAQAAISSLAARDVLEHYRRFSQTASQS